MKIFVNRKLMTIKNLINFYSDLFQAIQKQQ